MKSNFVHGCGDCGLSDLGTEKVEAPAKETTKDTVEEAKKYSNPEIPLWLKLTTAVGGFFLIKKLTKSK